MRTNYTPVYFQVHADSDIICGVDCRGADCGVIIIIIIIIIIKHVLIKVTLSCQRHCRSTAKSPTSKKEQTEAPIAVSRRQTIVAVYSTITIA